jgi:hypothetical protein
MKLADRTDLSPETIALYQRLEKKHSFNLKDPVQWFMVLTLAPTALVLVGLTPIALFGLLLSPLAIPKTLAMLASIWTSPAALVLAPVVLMGNQHDQAKAKRPS